MFGHSERIDIQVKSLFSLRHGWTKCWKLLVNTLKHIQIINHTNSNCKIVTSNEKYDIFENIRRLYFLWLIYEKKKNCISFCSFLI